MLTRELAIVEYKSGRVYPDRLTQRKHAQYRRYADQMLRIYRSGTGRTRQELLRDVHAVFERELECPARRIDAFCKLLDDVSTWNRDSKGSAAKLRREVFREAAKYHPLVSTADSFFEHDQQQVKNRIASQRGETWETIDAALFADVMQFHRLLKFEGFDQPSDLLARYNVAQTQTALFDAVHMTIYAKRDFKLILRYAKLAGLMHSIDRWQGDGYRFEFDGPASILSHTRRYGAAMARFLPGLLSCRGWRMHVVIQKNRKAYSNSLELSPADGLTSNVAESDDYDSTIEAKLAAKWGDASRDGWTMIREGEILHEGQKVFIPDFVFRHNDGRQVLLEVVGFWTPEYLQQKIETLKRFSHHSILLAVAESLGADKFLDDFPILPYKTVIKLDDLMVRLSGFGKHP